MSYTISDLAPQTPINSRILAELTEIVGEQNVQSSYKTRVEQSQVTIPRNQLCGAVIYPGTTAEIQEILKVAATYKLEVWPFSGGKNWGYGTKNALKSGSIILMLERLNRIIEVNEELAYAVIEPGVTQHQLNEYLKQHHIPLWIDCTDSTPYGSILGNAIERGYGYTPYGDHFSQLCGMEVVLPNGHLIRTGGPHPNTHTWNTHKWGAGPFLDGLFSQSNMGIIVKAGIWLMPEPESFQVFTLDLYEDADLPRLIDKMRILAMADVLQSHVHIVNDFQMLSVVTPKYPYNLLEKSTVLSPDVKQDLCKSYGIAPWTLVGGVYGSKEQVKLRSNSLKRELSHLGKVDFFDSKKVHQIENFIKLYRKYDSNSWVKNTLNTVKSLISRKHIDVIAVLPEMQRILQGIPTEHIIKSAYFKSKKQPPQTATNPAQDGCGVTWLAIAVPASRMHAQKTLDLAKPLFREHGFDFSGCFTRMNDRTFFFLMGIFHDRDNHEESNRALALYNHLVTATEAARYQQYRSGILSWNNKKHSIYNTTHLLDEIKRTIDPAGILAPGRYGILTTDKEGIT